MAPDDIIASTPIGSIISQPEALDSWYLEQLKSLPAELLDHISSLETGAYIRGLLKTFNVPLEQAPALAFILLELFVGDKTLAQLPRLLQDQLAVSPDRAAMMASEIEKELFTPVAGPWKQYVASKQRPATDTPPRSTNVKNLLDLKKQPPVNYGSRQ